MHLQVGTPCENGGECLRQPKLLMCECADGFTGPNCERRTPLLLPEVGHEIPRSDAYFLDSIHTCDKIADFFG